MIETPIRRAREAKLRLEFGDEAAAPAPAAEPERPAEILPLIVACQFAGTSLWFVGNAVAADLDAELGLGGDEAVADLTTAVQLGFIAGTLLLALSRVSDRVSSPRLFATCAVSGAVLDLLLLAATTKAQALAVRAGVGVMLAGIYPVGMRLAASWFPRGMGRALGYLVGALVLGTGFPHALKAGGGSSVSWQGVVVIVSITAAVGGLLVLLLVPEGPAARRAPGVEAGALGAVLRSPAFLAAAGAYWGHMWELYTFWALLPGWIDSFDPGLDAPLLSFFVVGVAGGLGCAYGGVLSMRLGSRAVAQVAMGVSGACCLLSPAIFAAPPAAFVAALLIWGVAVVADSPQLSSLTAAAAPPELLGTALTFATCVGFSITIVSIRVVEALDLEPQNSMLVLAPGPVLGLLALRVQVL